jgi:hypothetical protein
LSTTMIWLSLKRDFFIQSFVLSEETLLPTPLEFRGSISTVQYNER